jgi:hypothetical protein
MAEYSASEQRKAADYARKVADKHKRSPVWRNAENVFTSLSIDLYGLGESKECEDLPVTRGRGSRKT